MPIDLEDLNENQRRAVLWNDGPLLVLAGPGSGKTRVLTMRVARLLEEREDVSVLALTFTNKAAGEMRQRVDELLGQRADRARLCTFHSFALELLTQHGTHVGLRPDFSLVVEDEDRLALLESLPNPEREAGVATALRAEGHSIPSDSRQLLLLLDHLFAECYEGGPEAPGLVDTPAWIPLLFSRYCEALVGANQLDFGSLLHFSRRLLRENAGVARVVRVGWSHVCVDEFQDTNRAQYELLKQLVPLDPPKNLFVVADDDQIIYQWNGASPERMQALRADYGMELVQLPENYRCPAEIVDLANRLIAHNRMRTPDKLPLAARRSATLDKGVLRYGRYETQEAEVAAVAKDIRERQDVKPADCVILARTAKLLDMAASAIRDAGLVPYLARRKSDFESPVVRVMLQVLRLAHAPHDRDVLRRLCLAWQGLSDDAMELEDVVASAALVGGNFLRAWLEAATARAPAQAKVLLNRIGQDLVERLVFPGVLEWFLSEGWGPWRDEKDHELNDEIETWREILGQYTREHGPDDQTLRGHLQFMDLASKVPPAPPDAVRCLTVHGSKGLEFNHVYLIGMAQEVLPSFQALKKGPASREVEEERRNCFVAITRVQRSLTITRARQYYGWPKAPSQFIAEMGLTE